MQVTELKALSKALTLTPTLTLTLTLTMKVTELKALCKERGLLGKGRKAELVARLLAE